MKSSKTHQHIRVSGRYISVDFARGKWETSHAWGATAKSAAIEHTRSNLWLAEDEPKTVTELHDREAL